MSQIEVERFLGRVITDAEFRAMAASSLIKACCREGIALSTEEMSLLGTIDFSRLGLFAEELDDSIKRN